ncbi:hypothetical protein LR010_00820 [Candidatus Gracilibacteria bacterium]|nr:hypothetical protein [Candidatus Gracilibacteria bacterium]
MDKQLLITFLGVTISIIGVLYGYSKIANKSVGKIIIDFIMNCIFLSIVIAGIIGVGMLFDNFYSDYGEYAVMGVIFGIVIAIAIPAYIYWEKVDYFLYTKEGKSKWFLLPDAERSLNKNQNQFIKKLEKSMNLNTN